MATLHVRRSGRLSYRRQRNEDNDDDGVIEITPEEWYGTDNRNVESMYELEELEGQEKGVASMANVKGEKSGTSPECTVKDKGDTGAMEDRKAARILRKKKLADLVEKLKGKQDEKNGKKAVRKGKLAEIVKVSKQLADKDGKLPKGRSAGLVKNSSNQDVKGKDVAGKRKIATKTGKGKMKSLDMGINEHKEMEEGESTDDDFVASKKVKVNKAVDMKKKVSDATPTNGQFNANKGDGTDTDKLDKSKVDPVNTLLARIPPTNLFKVMTQMSDRQKEAVRDIGFGKLLDFRIKEIPKRLGYWLVDQFDEGTCCLNVNGREIEINKELVRDVLGVPIGELHLDALEESNHKNALTKEWKGQFPKTVKRYFVKRLAEKMLSNRNAGRMFKIYFLVLFFSTIGEPNKNNTANLKFLPCIKNEDDILKMDWCTYIIECLIKTKVQWNRKYHFNGPVVLLLVLYANSYCPIKWCDSAVLNKLQKERFPDDDGDDPAVVDESDDEGIEEEQEFEDDEFVGHGRDHAPTDAEGMKKYVSEVLKKAAEMLEMAEDVLDEGLLNFPDDAGFLELKDIRDQMFAQRTFRQKQGNYQPTNEQPYHNFHTPRASERQQETEDFDLNNTLPFTQVAIQLSDKACEEFYRTQQHTPTRLDFDDATDLDLNVTQPPATQGKEVPEGLISGVRAYVAQEPQNVPELKTPDQSNVKTPNTCSTSHKLSRFGREHLTNVNRSVIPIFSEPESLNMVEPHIHQNIIKRYPTQPEVLRSPYVVKEVSLVNPIILHEKRAADCLFSARLGETDIVFKTGFCEGQRGVLETLYPGVLIASGAIDMFTHVLNEAERLSTQNCVTKVFCHTTMLNEDMCRWDYSLTMDKFKENMDLVLDKTQYRSLHGVQLVFFPMILDSHFIVICMNMIDNTIDFLDNVFSEETDTFSRYGAIPVMLVSLFEDYLLHTNNPSYRDMAMAGKRILPLGCRTMNNDTDCGVFVMRHMETYKGYNHYGDTCCLSNEGAEQRRQLIDLRYKYAAKILLADYNQRKSNFETEVHAYKRTPDTKKIKWHKTSLERINRRAKGMMK